MRFILIAITLFTQNMQSGGKVLSPDKIMNLIPEQVVGFRQSGDAKGKVIKLGTMQYAMAEKNFSASRERAVKILLFDYKEAPIMYSQATRKFKTFTPVESDTVILRSVLMKECTGWESYNVQQKNSQILLGIRNRYFLTVEGKNVELEFLKKVVQEFKFETFPK